MIYEKSREELSPRDVTNMEDILKKDNNSLLPAERELLVARRDYLTDEELEKYNISDSDKKSDATTTSRKYAGMSYNDAKKEAKERGIILEKTSKLPEIIGLLDQYDNLKAGDEFQGKIAFIATQEMIDENKLSDELEVGDLYFVDKDAIEDEEK